MLCTNYLFKLRLKLNFFLILSTYLTFINESRKVNLLKEIIKSNQSKQRRKENICCIKNNEKMFISHRNQESKSKKIFSIIRNIKFRKRKEFFLWLIILKILIDPKLTLKADPNDINSPYYEPNTYFNECLSEHPYGNHERDFDCLLGNISKNIIHAKAIAYCGIKNGAIKKNEKYDFILNQAFKNDLIANKYSYLKERIYERYKEELTPGSQYNYIKYSKERINYIGGCDNLLKAYYPSFFNGASLENNKLNTPSKDEVIKLFNQIDD